MGGVPPFRENSDSSVGVIHKNDAGLDVTADIFKGWPMNAGRPEGRSSLRD